MRRFIQATVIVVATLVVLVIAWELREALILFVLSLAVAAATRAPANFWMKRGISRSLAIILTYLIGLVSLALLLYLVSGPVLRDLQQVTDSFDRVYRQITANWPHGTPFQQAIAQQLPAPQDLYNAFAGEQGTQLLQNFLGIASGFMTGLAQVAIILVLSIYWSFDRLHFERLWISLLTAEKRSRAREIWREVEDGTGGYIRSELVQSVLAGLLLGIGYSLMGLTYPALIALIGALLWLIPWLGAGLAVILPLVGGLYTAPVLAVAAPLYTILVLVFLELVVEPRMFDRRHYSSLLIVIVLVAMAQAYGLIGLLLAPPLAASIQILYTSLMRKPAPVVTEDLAIKVDSLRQRMEAVQTEAASMGEKLSPEITNLLGRLNNLMGEADQLFEADGTIDTTLKIPATQDASS